MDTLMTLATVCAAALFFYLGFVLLFPEKF